MVFTSLTLYQCARVCIVVVQEGKKSEKKKTILTREDNHGHQLYLVL